MWCFDIVEGCTVFKAFYEAMISKYPIIIPFKGRKGTIPRHGSCGEAISAA